MGSQHDAGGFVRQRRTVGLQAGEPVPWLDAQISGLFSAKSPHRKVGKIIERKLRRIGVLFAAQDRLMTSCLLEDPYAVP